MTGGGLYCLRLASAGRLLKLGLHMWPLADSMRLSFEPDTSEAAQGSHSVRPPTAERQVLILADESGMVCCLRLLEVWIPTFMGMTVVDITGLRGFPEYPFV